MFAPEELLEASTPEEHLVQFYESDEGALLRNVTRYLTEGLRRGEGVLAIATPAHVEAVTAALGRAGAKPHVALRQGRLAFLDAEETLARFMLDGHPDGARFEGSVGEAVTQARAKSKIGLRAYGEMVGLLWKSRQFPAAIRLEQLWHKLMQAVDFSLFCSYPIDVFGREFDAGVVDALLSAHTHLLPAGNNGDLEHALKRAADEVLGTNVADLRPLAGANRLSWAQMPRAESTILWLRHQLPDRADEVLERARRYYQAPPEAI